jgi:hypothetical protein
MPHFCPVIQQERALFEKHAVPAISNQYDLAAQLLPAFLPVFHGLDQRNID